MVRKKSKGAFLLQFTLVAGLLSVMSTASVEDKKTYYSPDPHARTPPTGSHHHTPSHGSGGSHGSTPPSHGSGGSGHGSSPPFYCGTPPSPSGGHYNPTPEPPTGGGGGHYDPTPAPPTGGGGGHYDPTPAPPTGGGGGHYDPTPAPPTGGGGGHYDPTPAPPTGGGYYSPPSIGGTPPVIIPPTPSTPTIISPPTSPFIDPGTPSVPGISVPSPPFDPNSPPFTCDYWRTHPMLIWGMLGYYGTTIGGAFGLTGTPGFSSHISLQQALSNTRTDGYGALYREGTAALLNSMAIRRFPFTTLQVRDNFISALSSNKAAAAQAQVFKQANEGH